MGLRFGLLEIKVVLIRVLKRYVIERCAETQVPVEKATRSMRNPLNGVKVKLTPR